METKRFVMGNKSFEFSVRYKRLFFIFGVLGLLAIIFGFIFWPTRTWTNLLLNNFYFLGLSLSGTFFLALQYLTKASWADIFRRIPESLTAFLPYGGVLMLAVALIGMGALYHWAEPGVAAHDPHLAKKLSYLNPTFFLIRLIAVVAVWIIFSKIIVSNSRKQDEVGGLDHFRRNLRHSCFFMVLFALTFSVASFDWIMSLEPHWYSTIFGIYTFSGLFVNGVAAISLVVVLLKEQGYLADFNENHLHDLGKLLFAFSTFWAYIWFSQFLLIWYANIPEETVYYVHRLRGDWDWLFYTNFIVNFVVPFFILLPRSSKRSFAMMKRVSVLLLIGHWLDLYLLIAPATLKNEAHVGILEVCVAVGYVGFFLYIVGRSLSRAPLIPVRSPLMQECLHFHQ